MRTVLVLGLVISISSGAVAQPAPCDCNCCPEPPPPQLILPALPPLDETETPAYREARRELWAIIGSSIAFFVVGEGISLAYAFSDNRADRVLGLLPVAGPITVVARDHLSGEWASGMVFAAWLQAASVITAAVAGHALGELKAQPNISLRPGGATFELMTRF
jgi:hypothetical protein